jgi:5-methylcytosine-specific restriction endonuclease McrA
MQVDYAEVERLGDEIAELSSHLEAATARLLDRIREFDARGGWNNGFRSCAEWLSWRVGLDRGGAREKVRVARALAHLPLLRVALGRGEISYAKTRAVTRVATPENEDLLKLARAGTADHVEQVVRGWRGVDRRAELDEAKRQHVYRTLQVYPDDDGTVVVRGRLTPEAGALLMRALDAAREALYRKRAKEDDPPTMAQQQADALVLLAEAALHHGIDPGTSGERYQVVVHVDAAVLANADQPGQSVLEEAGRVSAETSQRLACDASRVVMQEDADCNIVEIGARTRTIPPALRRALQRRDKRCTFPGCHVRIAEGHHIEHWAHGGPTKLSNLALLCRRHHRAVHEDGFRLERKPEGALIFHRPNGWVLPHVPESPPVSADPIDEVRKENEANGLQIDPQTLKPLWSGETFDLGWVIDVLHPKANRPAEPPADPPAAAAG